MEWSILPEELLIEIARKLADISDFVRFRVVCKPWRSAVQPADLPPKVPWLLLDDNRKNEHYSFYDLDTEIVHQLHLPEISNSRVCGSCDGWLVLLSRGDTDSLSLLQPLTRSHISLPPLERGILVSQARLSSSPSSGRCTVVAWMPDSDKLYSCKLGPDRRWSQWTIIPSPLKSLRNLVVSRDHDDLYAMNYYKIFHYELKNKTARVIPLPENVCQHQAFLLESPSGELLLAVKFPTELPLLDENSSRRYRPSTLLFENFRYRLGPYTFTLEVYRLKDEEWVKLQGRSIDDDLVLCLSYCQSLSSNVGHGGHVYLATHNSIIFFSLKDGLKDGNCTDRQQLLPRTAWNQTERFPMNTWLVPSLIP